MDNLTKFIGSEKDAVVNSEKERDVKRNEAVLPSVNPLNIRREDGIHDCNGEEYENWKKI